MIRYEPRAPRLDTCRQAIVSQLADAMREMAFAGENVTPESLEQRGFPRDVTEALGSDAVALARRRSIRRAER